MVDGMTAGVKTWDNDHMTLPELGAWHKHKFILETHIHGNYICTLCEYFHLLCRRQSPESDPKVSAVSLYASHFLKVKTFLFSAKLLNDAPYSFMST